jgi:hypothetical protein
METNMQRDVEVERVERRARKRRGRFRMSYWRLG